MLFLKLLIIFTYPENMVPESPLHPKFVPETPLPPPIPSFSPVNFVPTVPITPARLQGQRWRNWANTRLGHLPQNLVYTEEEIMQRFEEADNVVVLDNRDNPRVNVDDDIPMMNEVEDIPDDGDALVAVAPKKTITAKPVKEKKRNLVFKVPEDEKRKCLKGKWTVNT